MPVLVEYTITRNDRVASVWQAQRFCEPAKVPVMVPPTKVITVGGRRYLRRDLA